MSHVWYLLYGVYIMSNSEPIFPVIRHASAGCSFVHVHMNRCHVFPVIYVNTEWITHKGGDRLAESPFR